MGGLLRELILTKAGGENAAGMYQSMYIKPGSTLA
jgi:hypothetical protein